jgi:hypothetical protein
MTSRNRASRSAIQRPTSRPGSATTSSSTTSVGTTRSRTGGGCWLSTTAGQSSGRPRCSYNCQEWLTYALLLALHDGKPLEGAQMRMKAKTLTVDHTCQDETCDNHRQLARGSGAGIGG